MASRLLTSGKIFFNISFQQQVRQSFILHRDFLSCLSLKESMQIVKERQNDVRKYGKTALLQFLNRYPMNYSMKSDPGQHWTQIFKFSLTLQNLNPYQQQLRYGILFKLKQYSPNDRKPQIQPLIHNQQLIMEQQIQKRPYDIVNALNFLIYQKNSRNNVLFYHSIDVVKRADKNLISNVLIRAVPYLLKRLHIQQWNMIRQFELYTDYLTFDYVPKDQPPHQYIALLQNLADLQLHTVGYHKIPPAIDYIVNYFVQQIQKGQQIDMFKLQILLKTYDRLPFSYNQKAFRLILDHFLQKPETESIHLNSVPFRKLNEKQTNLLLEKVSRDESSIVNTLVFAGNIPECQKIIMNNEYFKRKLWNFVEKFKIQRVNMMNFTTYLLAANLLLGSVLQNSSKTQSIAKSLKDLIHINRHTYLARSNLKHFSLATCYHLLSLQFNFRIGLSQQNCNTILKDILSRSQIYAQALPFLGMVIQAMHHYINSSIPQIRHSLASVLQNILKKQPIFLFQKFTHIIVLLQRSVYIQEYLKVLEGFYDKLADKDCSHFVQIYNRVQQKNVKVNTNIIKKIWNKDPSFRSMSRFMISSNYSFFTSSWGDLKSQFKKILQELEVGLNYQDIKKFKLIELSACLRFVNNFYDNISNFSQKLLLLSINRSLECDQCQLKKQGLVSMIGFIKQCMSIQGRGGGYKEINGKILSFLKRVMSIYPESFYLKIKQIQIKGDLGLIQNEDRKALIVDQVLSNLSAVNYSQAHANTMMTLLKLKALDMIQLKQNMEYRLKQLLLQMIKTEEFNHSQISNMITFSKNQLEKINLIVANSPQNLKNLIEIVRASLARNKSKYGFQYFFGFVDFAHKVKSAQLVKQSLQVIVRDKISASQIRKLFMVLKFYRNMELSNNLYQNLIQQVFNNKLYIRDLLSEIMHTIQSLKNNFSQKNDQIIKQILADHSQYLIQNIKNPENIISFQQKNSRHEPKYYIIVSILKHLWCCIQKDVINTQMAPLFDYISDQRAHIENLYATAGTLQGIPSNQYKIIFLACHQYFYKGGVKTAIKNEKEVPVKKSFIEKKKIAVPDFKYQNHPYLSFWSQNSQLITQQIKQQLQSQLKKMSSSQTGKSTFGLKKWQLNKNIRGIIMHGWFYKDFQDHGVIVLDNRYFNQKKEIKGRAGLMLNCLKMITRINIVGFIPGQPLKIQ